jgi:hypothetical protein
MSAPLSSLKVIPADPEGIPDKTYFQFGLAST